MLHAPSLEVIHERLEHIALENWGPDGMRYVCILFWNDVGYRHLRNPFGIDQWREWHNSSGEFWDLFLAGCYSYAPSDFYGGEPAQELASWGPFNDKQKFYWNQGQSGQLAEEVAELAERAGTPRPWTFTGPIDIVAVGARRLPGNNVDIDWASLRGAPIRSIDLPEAIGSYTEAHITLDSDDIPAELPTPGSFTDDDWPEIKRLLKKAAPLFGKLIVRAHLLS